MIRIRTFLIPFIIVLYQYFNINIFVYLDDTFFRKVCCSARTLKLPQSVLVISPIYFYPQCTRISPISIIYAALSAYFLSTELITMSTSLFAEVVWFCRIFCLASKVFQVYPFISFRFYFNLFLICSLFLFLYYPYTFWV